MIYMFMQSGTEWCKSPIHMHIDYEMISEFQMYLPYADKF